MCRHQRFCFARRCFRSGNAAFRSADGNGCPRQHSVLFARRCFRSGNATFLITAGSGCPRQHSVLTRSTASLAETASTCFRNQRFCQGQTCLKLAVARLACDCLLLFLIVPARFLLILSLACSCSKYTVMLPQQGCHLRSAACRD